MKAMVYTKYGSPDVLQLKEVEKPVPMDNDILIKVHAVSVNPYDWHHLRGAPFPLRFLSGLFKPKHKILGIDVAGRVEEVGGNVQQFQPGDEVFGDLSECGHGGFAEYVCVAEHAPVVQKPTSMTFEEAAAAPMAAVTALQALRDHGKIQPGQRVLINGASGGVGTFAVQLAKSYGAEVIGVCSSKNTETVRSIGADQIIDYTQEDFIAGGRRYDLILDAVGNIPISKYRHALSPKGIGIMVGYTAPAVLFQVVFLGSWIPKSRGVKVGTMVTKPNQEDLTLVKTLLEAGKLKPIIGRRYRLHEVPDAIRYLEEGHARGKVVVTVVHDDESGQP
jgi:NADPH:quinone reductase-like Zn-dependent oxidoreductase